MATKLYLESSGVPPISPTPNAGWTDTAQFTRFITSTTKAASTMTTKNITDASSIQADVIIGQWISHPLNVGQTITGAQTISIQARSSETLANNNLFMSWAVYVFNNTTLQKTVITKRNDATEVATSLTNRTDSTSSVAGNYTTVAGDRIVIEVGLEGDPAGSNNHIGSMSCGSDSATDLPSDDTTTAANNPNVILNDTLTFNTSSPSSSASLSPSSSPSSSSSSSSSASPSPSSSVSLSPSSSPSASPSSSSSSSVSLSPSSSPSSSASSSSSSSASSSASSSVSLSPSSSPSASPSASVSPSPSPVFTMEDYKFIKVGDGMSTTEKIK